MWKWKILAIFTPSCWLQGCGNFNKKYDKWLNDCIDKGVDFKVKSRFNAEILGVEVWIANHPYASFTTEYFGLEARPSRATILKAHKHLMECIKLP